jgi:tripartite ATP-independent transporter DctP family solute receptor
MNRRTFLHGTGTLALAAGAGMPTRSQAAVQLKLGHQLGPTHPSYEAVEAMAKAIAERTKGEVSIQIYPNSALGSPPEMVQQAQQGAIDFVMFNPPNIESQDRTAGVIQIPYQFDSYEHAHRTLGVTARPWLEKMLTRNRLVWVSNFEYGFRSLTNSKRPIVTPDDVAGLKIRVPPELSIKATFEALGASTQTISFNELYLALSSGTVDGQDNPVAVNYANKFYEVQKHIATTQHIYTSYMLTANPKSWERMTDAQRAIISEEAVKAGKWAQQAVIQSEQSMLQDMEKAGIQVTRPDPVLFRQKMEPAYAQLRKRIGDEAWEQWMEFVKAAKA